MSLFDIRKLIHKIYNIQVIVQTGDSPPVLAYLNPSDKLSVIRKELTNDGTINDTLSFSKKDNNENVLIKNEEGFCLNDILDKSHVLYLKPNWKFFNNRYKLDYGCTMDSEPAKKRAFIMKDCGLTYIGAKG